MVEIKQFDDYRLRVKTEYDELLERTTKLYKFVWNDMQDIASIDYAEKMRLINQLYIMGQYLEILKLRITAFKS